MEWFMGNGWLSHETDEEGLRTNSLVGLQVCIDGDQGWTQIEISNEKDDAASTSPDVKDYPMPISNHVARPGQLRFRTQSALFRLSDRFHGSSSERKYSNLQILNLTGSKISEMEVEREWAEKPLRKTGNREHRVFKFVAISAICFPPHWTISHLERYILGADASVTDEVKAYLDSIEYEGIRIYPETGKDLHVMLIEPNGDAARRIGVTSVRLETWLQSDPKMEDVVLE